MPSPRRDVDRDEPDDGTVASGWEHFSGNTKAKIAAVYAVLSIVVLLGAALVPFAGWISAGLALFGAIVAMVARRETNGSNKAGRGLAATAGAVCVIVALFNAFTIFAVAYGLV